jgi:hypothetical protein
MDNGFEQKQITFRSYADYRVVMHKTVKVYARGMACLVSLVSSPLLPDLPGSPQLQTVDFLLATPDHLFSVFQPKISVSTRPLGLFDLLASVGYVLDVPGSTTFCPH